MGYGLGAFLLAVGLILALAVQDSIGGVDLVLVGWIMAAVGLVAIVLTLITASSGSTMGRRGTRSVTTTTNPDGTQSTTDSRTDMD